MTLYGILEANPRIRWVSLIWTHETTLKELARLGGRAYTLIYKGDAFDLSRSFVGPYSAALDFALYVDSWDDLDVQFNEASGVLSGVHRVGYGGRCARPRELSDYSPSALEDLRLV